MKDITMNALSGILLERVLSALGSTKIHIKNFVISLQSTKPKC